MKNKKKFLRVVAIFLLLAMALSSCGKNDEGADTSSDSVQNIDLSQYILISDDYKLIRPDSANDNVVDILKYFTESYPRFSEVLIHLTTIG